MTTTTEVAIRRPLLLGVLAALVCTSPAAADFPIVKRIRTSRAEVTSHIRNTPSFRGGDGAPASSVKHIQCTGYHFNRAHKAKTWRCTYQFTYTGDPRVCTGRYHGGYVRFRIADGRLGKGWHDDAIDKSCP